MLGNKEFDIGFGHVFLLCPDCLQFEHTIIIVIILILEFGIIFGCNLNQENNIKQFFSCPNIEVWYSRGMMFYPGLYLIYSNNNND